MLKKTLLFLILFFSSVRMFAYEPEVTFGTRQGVVGSTVWFYPSVDLNYLYGYTGGFTSRIILQKYVGLQVELNYMQRGWKENYKPTFDYLRKLHYIEIPFMTHVFVGKKWFRWFLNAGLNLSFMMKDRIYSTAFPGAMPEHDLKVSNRLDYGICGGTGVEFHTRAGIYQLEARYNFGLGDIFHNRLKDNFSRSSNQCLSVCLGVLFDINKEKYKKK